MLKEVIDLHLTYC